MIHVKIKNVASQNYSHGAKFDTLELAQSWIDGQLAKGLNCPWGKPEHQVEVLDANGMSFDPPQYETVPSEFTVEVLDITTQVNHEKLKADKIKKGKEARITCEQVLDLIAGYNFDRQLTIPQITEMQQKFATIESALKSGRAVYAKQLINSLTVDEILVTQEMKVLCLELLAKY